tara:strand:- start:132 stop:383 length:252 start_codon:yes stop_codon:yes gene_type:complete
MSKKEEETINDEKGLPPLTDDEKRAIEAASDVNNMEDVTVEQKQRHFNRMSEVYPNIRKELREALNLPMKMYGGGSVRPNRGY